MSAVATVQSVWFAVPGRVDRLHAVAQSWLDTPFSGNGCMKGPRGGVSCQKLVGLIYRECNCCSVEVPEAPMNYWRFHRDSLIVPFMATLPQFAILDEGRPTKDLLPGDLLGFRLNHCIHHLGIAMSPITFIHCMTSVQFAHLTDPTWLSRYACAWRPVDA